MKYFEPDNRFIKEVLEDKVYSFVNYYPVVIDMGANIGTFSFYIYDHADKIYAIEPVEENIKSLQKTIEMNNLTKILVKQLAISNQSIVKNMMRKGDPKMGGWSIDETGDYSINCFTLKDFIENEKIEYVDLVKIDVEGEELNILQTIDFPKDKVGTIIGEFHYEDIRRIKMKETLEWLGFRYYEFPNNYFLARHL